MSRDDDRIACDLYSLGQKLGAGSFGDVYRAENTKTGEQVAVKLEDRSGKHAVLIHEARLLKELQGAPGICALHYFSGDGDVNVLVMDLLGLSLEDHFCRCERTFSLKTVLMLADQIMQRIEYLHSKNFVHRDIKPENFAMGHGRKANVVYLIDFGLTKRFRNPRTQQHIPYCENKSLTGTARYASINAHLGIEQSRRDDLEAIGYVLMYFNRGQLPWQGIQVDCKKERYRKIAEIKRNTPVEKLCEGHSQVFSLYLKYCRQLHYEDRPDYVYLRRLFKILFVKLALVDDGLFDWSS